jgi:hypothetical protein
MEDNDIIAFFVSCGGIITLGSVLFFIIRSFILAYKHDKYIDKHFLELSETESIIFGPTWNMETYTMNVFSPTKAAPDEYISKMRRKIRYSLLWVLLSMTMLPLGSIMLLVFILTLRYWLT